MKKLEEIAGIINGELKGNPHKAIASINSLENAGQGDIAFTVSETIDPKKTKAGALIVKRGSPIRYPDLIFVDHPYLAFATLLGIFFPRQRFNDGIDGKAAVSPTATLGSNVSIGSFSVVGDHSVIGDNSEIHAGVIIYGHVKIGRHCLIYSNVVIREEVEIGDHVIIQPGAVIGSDGFGFTRDHRGKIVKIPQKGRVIIGNHCEIGANTCIDRSTIEKTELKDFVKTDNLIQIGHNVTIGQSTRLSAQTGISGSTEIGENVLMGGQVGIGDHLKIADGVMIAGKTGVTGHVKNTSIIAGYPHREIKKWRRENVLLRNLEGYVDRLKDLEKKVKKMEEK